MLIKDEARNVDNLQLAIVSLTYTKHYMLMICHAEDVGKGNQDGGCEQHQRTLFGSLKFMLICISIDCYFCTRRCC